MLRRLPVAEQVAPENADPRRNELPFLFEMR
jgi:hypothetical protein